MLKSCIFKILFLTISVGFIYYKPSQKCRSRSRTRREPMKKRSIHGSMWAFWSGSQHSHWASDAFLRWLVQWI